MQFFNLEISASNEKFLAKGGICQLIIRNNPQEEGCVPYL